MSTLEKYLWRRVFLRPISQNDSKGLMGRAMEKEKQHNLFLYLVRFFVRCVKKKRFSQKRLENWSWLLQRNLYRKCNSNRFVAVSSLQNDESGLNWVRPSKRYGLQLSDLLQLWLKLSQLEHQASSSSRIATIQQCSILDEKRICVQEKSLIDLINDGCIPIPVCLNNFYTVETTAASLFFHFVSFALQFYWEEYDPHGI